MFYRKNVQLCKVKEFNFNGNERFSYLIHLEKEHKYISMIGNVKVPKFQENMLVDIEFSMSQQENNSFKCFVTGISPLVEGAQK